MSQPAIEVLTDDRITPRVLDILRNAKKHVTLVSPYNTFWMHLRNEIQIAVSKGVRVDFIYRKDERKESVEWIEGVGVRTHAVKNLHAKIYLNESSVLITSMNLLESSSKNSMEICISLRDKNSQQEVRDYVNTLLQLANGTEEFEKTPASTVNYRTKTGKSRSVAEGKAKYDEDGNGETNAEQSRGRSSKRVSKPKEPSTSFKRPARRSQKKVAAAKPSFGGLLKDLAVVITGGRCIRCKDSMDFDPDRPLCDDCFKSWKRYENWDYEEDYCHRCGTDWGTSYAKPLCRPCYDQVAA